jgi:hypothetical protein
MTVVLDAAAPIAANLLDFVASFPGVYNAENLTMTDSGRVFVTGSGGVYEVSAGEGGLTPLQVNAPADAMINGIACDQAALYVACAMIHAGNNPLLPEWACDVHDLEHAKSFTVVRLLLAEMVGHVDSFILRADLRDHPVFDRVVAQGRTRMFANGIAVDEAGRVERPGTVYVANSYPGASAGIYRASTAGDAAADLELWHDVPGYAVNGVKIADGAVYCTASSLGPPPHSALIRVRAGKSGGTPEAEVILRRAFAFFDDFDLFGDGFVIAEVGGLRRLPELVGELLFVDAAGNIVEATCHEKVPHPSAVKAITREAGPLEPDDLLVTEKSSHALVWLRPQPGLRQRLSPRP